MSLSISEFLWFSILPEIQSLQIYQKSMVQKSIVFNSTRHPGISNYQKSRDSRLPDIQGLHWVPDIQGLQTTRHLGSPGYQTSSDSRLPDIQGLQTTRHLGTPGYQTSGDSRLPDIYGLQATRHLGFRLPDIYTMDYQTSDQMFHQVLTFNWPYSNFSYS